MLLSTNIKAQDFGYKGLRYGHNQVIAKSHGKTWTNGSLRRIQKKKKLGEKNLTLRAPRLSRPDLEIQSAAPWSS